MATRTLVQILTTALLVAACGPKVAAPSRPARINHLAFFKLKHPEDAQALIAACDNQLATIPGVEAYWCGQHGDFGRTTIDADYDVGFYVGFADADTYEQYVKHPNHQHLVRTWKPRLEWIRVHDVVDETP